MPVPARSVVLLSATPTRCRFFSAEIIESPSRQIILLRSLLLVSLHSDTISSLSFSLTDCRFALLQFYLVVQLATDPLIHHPASPVLPVRTTSFPPPLLSRHQVLFLIKFASELPFSRLSPHCKLAFSDIAFAVLSRHKSLRRFVPHFIPFSSPRPTRSYPPAGVFSRSRITLRYQRASSTILLGSLNSSHLAQHLALLSAPFQGHSACPRPLELDLTRSCLVSKIYAPLSYRYPSSIVTKNFIGALWTRSSGLSTIFSLSTCYSCCLKGLSNIFSLL
ncbi:hypothetical protein BJX99DRAFT_207821 [Aspergillus californicus]